MHFFWGLTDCIFTTFTTLFLPLRHAWRGLVTQNPRSALCLVVYKELICEIFLIKATIPTVVNHIVFWGSFNAKFDSTIYTLHLSWFAGNINHGFSGDYSYLVSLILWSVLKANNNDDDDNNNNTSRSRLLVTIIIIIMNYLQSISLDI